MSRLLFNIYNVYQYGSSLCYISFIKSYRLSLNKLTFTVLLILNDNYIPFCILLYKYMHKYLSITMFIHCRSLVSVILFCCPKERFLTFRNINLLLVVCVHHYWNYIIWFLLLMFYNSNSDRHYTNLNLIFKIKIGYCYNGQYKYWVYLHSEVKF